MIDAMDFQVTLRLDAIDHQPDTADPSQGGMDKILVPDTRVGREEEQNLLRGTPQSCCQSILQTPCSFELCGLQSDWCALSFSLPAVMQAHCDQVGDIGFAHAHDRVRTAPVDFHGSVGLRDGAAGEHDVVDIARDFPGIFWL